MVSITEKFILFALDDKKGGLIGTRSAIEFGISGSMLFELALAGKLKLDKSSRVTCIDEQPSGNPLPDKALRLIAKSKKPQPLLKWMVNLTMQDSRTIESIYLQQMVQKGLLKRTTRPVLGIFKANSYFPTTLEIRKEILVNIKKVIHLKRSSDPHAILLLGLIDRCNLLKDWFTAEEIQLYGNNSKQIYATLYENRSSDDPVNFYLTVLEAITFSQRSAGSLLFDSKV
jgi:Golgi phosphoprotein 3